MTRSWECEERMDKGRSWEGSERGVDNSGVLSGMDRFLM